MNSITRIVLNPIELTVMLYIPLLAYFFTNILRKNKVIKNLKILPIMMFVIMMFVELILGYFCGYKWIVLYIISLPCFFIYFLRKNNVIKNLKTTILLMPIMVLVGIILSIMVATVIIQLLVFYYSSAVTGVGG